MDELLDKVKGGVDELLDKVKGHHIENVKGFEEKVKRLQLEVEDLRCEFFKERLTCRGNPVTTITPDVELHKNVKADEDQDDLSSDSASNIDMEPATFLTNVLAMDNIFGYLDVKQLKECRLISKHWNKAASSILSKRNNGNGLGINLQLNAPDEDDDRDIQAEYLNKYLEKTQELHSIVEAAPKNSFRILNLEDNIWTRDAYKSIFQDFGNRVKVINVTSIYLHFQTLRSILLDWFPNLEELAFSVIQLEAGRILEISLPLKLTRLSFIVGDYHASTPYRDVAEVIFTIIINSPNLKKLESNGWYTTVAKIVFSKLQNNPEILNKMEEIILRDSPFGLMDSEDMQDPLEALSNIQFQSKLKNLVLISIKPGQSIALSRLLNRTSESLEKLSVISDENPRIPPSVGNPNFQLKQMNCLREFRYEADRQCLMDSIDILAKMPNLKIFVLGFDTSYYYDSRDDLVGRIFLNCRQLMRNPHQNLNELHLLGRLHNILDTFDVIERGFPNLTKLVVRIHPSPAQWFEEFSDLFKGISKLKKLIKLFLDLRFLPECCIECNITMLFSYFKSLKNVLHLTLQTQELDLLDEALLNKLPKLQRLTLIGVKMDLIKARKLGQLLNERRIILDLQEEIMTENGEGY